MDNLPCLLRVLFSDNRMQVLPLVNPHETGPRVRGDNAIGPAKGNYFLNTQTVCRLDIRYADLEVVKIREIIRGSELVEYVSGVNEVREQLRIVITSFFNDIRFLSHPLTD